MCYRDQLLAPALAALVTGTVTPLVGLLVAWLRARGRHAAERGRREDLEHEIGWLLHDNGRLLEENRKLRRRLRLGG